MSLISEENPMWGGRFDKGASAIMKAINSSIEEDVVFIKQDIDVSRAHCEMLAKQSIISKDESQKILAGLDVVEQKFLSGELSLKEELEDVHMNVESALFDIIGEPAGKLHTARSRNDQVVAGMKMWIREQHLICIEFIHAIQLEILDIAEMHFDTPLLGLTHLQAAQPVTFGHHMMAYFEMFERDKKRFLAFAEIADECPLGASALGGTSFPIDRFYTAQRLGFSMPTRNSMDSVASRDFIIDFLYACSSAVVTLGRLAEEIVLWSSPTYKFITLSDDMTTGSSAMPQKRNPDAAELIRAKGHNIFGFLNGALAIVQGLPLTYSKDLQQVKTNVIKMLPDFFLCFQAMKLMLHGLKVNVDAMLKFAVVDFADATDLADLFTHKYGIPFRQAHKIVGALVKEAESVGSRLVDLEIATIHKICPFADINDLKGLTLDNILRSRKSFGSANPDYVLSMVMEAKKLFKGERE